MLRETFSSQFFSNFFSTLPSLHSSYVHTFCFPLPYCRLFLEISQVLGIACVTVSEKMKFRTSLESFSICSLNEGPCEDGCIKRMLAYTRSHKTRPINVNSFLLVTKKSVTVKSASYILL